MYVIFLVQLVHNLCYKNSMKSTSKLKKYSLSHMQIDLSNELISRKIFSEHFVIFYCVYYSSAFHSINDIYSRIHLRSKAKRESSSFSFAISVRYANELVTPQAFCERFFCQTFLTGMFDTVICYSIRSYFNCW